MRKECRSVEMPSVAEPSVFTKYNVQSGRASL